MMDMPEELIAGIAVLPDGRVVDREEGQGVHVEDPHRLRVRLEQQPVPAVRLLGLPVEPRVLHRERGALGQLAGEMQVGLGEAPARTLWR